MLKHRLIFGILMSFFFVGVVVFDGWLAGSLTASSGKWSVAGTCVFVLIAALAIPAQLELSRLAAAKTLKVFTVVTIPGTILLAAGFYVAQFAGVDLGVYVFLALVFVLFALFFYQSRMYGNSGVIGNCGAGLFSVVYLGLLSGFVVGLEVEFGAWYLLMFVATVKFSDIGAYTFGRLFGRHKFSPRISPGKTWEGMAGAALVSGLTAGLFAVFCDIITVKFWQAFLFGVGLAFIGQLGVLAESMMKRDAEQKDSAKMVPGFGGVLDIIDSPLVAAPFAYLFFQLTLNGGR